MYLNRTLSQALGQALDAFPAVLLTGPRQSGKTTFLRHELGERYSNLADEVTRQPRTRPETASSDARD